MKSVVDLHLDLSFSNFMVRCPWEPLATENLDLAGTYIKHMNSLSTSHGRGASVECAISEDKKEIVVCSRSSFLYQMLTTHCTLFRFPIV